MKISEQTSKSKLWTPNFITILIVNAIAFLGFNMATAGTPAYMSSNGAENSIVGLSTTFAAVASLVMRPVAGLLVDRTNPKVVGLFGLLLMSFPTFIFSATENVYMILVIRSFQGAGWAFSSTAFASIIAIVAPGKRMSEGIGFAGAASSITAAFAPTIAFAVLGHVGGTAMMLSVGAIFGISGILLVMLNMKLCVTNCIEKEVPKKNLFEPKARVPALLISIVMICYSPLITFIVPFSKCNGIMNVTTFYVSYAVATILSRPLTGYFVDKYRKNTPIYMAMMMAAVSVLLTCLADTEVTLIFVGIISGVSTGTGINSLQTMALTSVDFRRKGVAMSTFLFGFDSGMALGSVIGGIIADILGYNRMFLLFSVFPIVGMVVFYMLEKHNCE